MEPLHSFSTLDRALAAAVAVLVLAGLLVLALIPGFGAEVAGAALLGIAGVVAVSLFFLMIGESEDRDRERGRN